MNGPTDIYLAAPRGFCAGVKRAVDIVENALRDYGAPVFVRHEIVHNRHVVENLRRKGAVFIENLEEIKDKTRPVVFSAHGAAREVYEQAAALGLKVLDATCPLVARVHRQIRKFEEEGRRIIVIGKKEHPEIIGTTGQLNHPDRALVIGSRTEAENLPPFDGKTGVVTQTTLETGAVNDVIAILKNKMPQLETQTVSDICYATTHRQSAVREIAGRCDAVVIIGSQNSSNSRHLKETALKNGVKNVWLIDDVSELPFAELKNVQKLGISAGASAPEHLVQELLSALQKHYANLKIHDIIVAEEHIEFKS